MPTGAFGQRGNGTPRCCGVSRRSLHSSIGTLSTHSAAIVISETECDNALETPMTNGCQKLLRSPAKYTTMAVLPCPGSKACKAKSAVKR